MRIREPGHVWTVGIVLGRVEKIDIVDRRRVARPAKIEHRESVDLRIGKRNQKRLVPVIDTSQRVLVFDRISDYTRIEMKEARDNCKIRTIVLFEGELVSNFVIEDSPTEVNEEVDEIFRKLKSVLEAPVLNCRRRYQLYAVRKMDILEKFSLHCRLQFPN